MYNQIKRIIDFTLACIGVIILSPILIGAAIAIKLDSRGPILFCQKRVGCCKQYFEIYKFRTMRIDTPKDVPTHLMNDPHRYITKLGAFLRKSSLDELPQLFNIIKGEMAIIGPRPALWNQIDLIAERDLYKANDIRPGLSGWAQVNGRDELPIQQKARLDGEYVEKMSLSFDLKCLILTLVGVLKQDGISEGSHNHPK